MEQTNNRLFYVSLLKVCASLGVVMLHCNGVFWTYPAGQLWITANFIETFMYWPVPIFFMLTGLTLMNYRDRYSTKKFFAKRIKQVAIPFLFWSLIGYIYRIVLHGQIRTQGVRMVLSNIFNTKYISIYWFFIPLFSAYLCIPFFSLISRETRLKAFKYLIIGGLTINTALPLFCKLVGITMNKAFSVPAVSGFILFVLLGYYLGNIDIPRNYRYLIYLFGFLGWLLHFVGTSVLSSQIGAVDRTFKGYTNLPSVLQAMAVFVFFRYLPIKSITPFLQRFQKWITQLADYTFGVYLMHIYLVWQLPVRLHFSRDSIIWRTVGAVGVFALCSAITYVMKKIPITKRVV